MALFAGCLGRVLVLDRSILPTSSASYLLHHTCHIEAVGESRLGTTSIRPSQDLRGEEETLLSPPRAVVKGIS